MAGDLVECLKYKAMLATNLSILGVSASQIDNKMDTQSFALNVGGTPSLTDTGYQLQASAMAVKDLLQLYVTGSQVFGDYGTPPEFRAGAN